jgi:uncharacterized Fe-S radical SAM superfamily protein PflX
MSLASANWLLPEAVARSLILAARTRCYGAFNAPMLGNSNFFMTLESMKILRILTDVWLPDFKFGPGRCAMTLAKTPATGRR